MPSARPLRLALLGDYAQPCAPRRDTASQVPPNRVVSSILGLRYGALRLLIISIEQNCLKIRPILHYQGKNGTLINGWAAEAQEPGSA
jgi:hypothetical protein